MWTLFDSEEETVYKGEVLNGERHGVGRMQFRYGVYVGEWRHDQRWGKGTFFKHNGGVYEGDWESDHRSGSGCVNISPTGVWYCGDYLRDEANGRGEMRWPNGDYFEGEWKNNSKNGKGFFRSERLGYTFEGEYLDDHRHKGEITWFKGDLWVGRCSPDKRYTGALLLKASQGGDVLLGQWSDYFSLREGEGSMVLYRQEESIDLRVKLFESKFELVDIESKGETTDIGFQMISELVSCLSLGTATWFGYFPDMRENLDLKNSFKGVIEFANSVALGVWNGCPSHSNEPFRATLYRNPQKGLWRDWQFIPSVEPLRSSGE